MITEAIRKLGREARWKELKSWPAEQRKCRRCLKFKALTDFHKHRFCFKGRNTVCKQCRKPISKEQQKHYPLECKLFNSAKSRAKRKHFAFNILLSDIVIPKLCPVFNVPLVRNTNYAPSVDRINPKKGYIKRNIRVISKRANTLRNNGTIAEFKMVIADLRRQDVTKRSIKL